MLDLSFVVRDPKQTSGVTQSTLFRARFDRIFDVFELGDFDVLNLAVHLLDTADVNGVDDVPRIRSINTTPRGLSHFMPFMALIRLSPSALPPVFFRAS
jgi:hypothetical protein